MSFHQSFSEQVRFTKFLLYVTLLMFSMRPQAAARSNQSSGAPLVLLGTLQSTSLQYQGVGKASGAEYKGTARVKVLEVLGSRDRQPSGIASEQVLVLRVGEQHKKPTWEMKKGQRFVFALEPIAGSSEFRVLDVGNADETIVRTLRESSQLSIEQLRKILHPNDPR